MTDPWILAIIGYLIAAVGTFIPTLLAILRGVKPHEGGASFDKSTHFSDEAKARLSQHFSRIAGTFGFWKKQSETFRRLHYYTLLWTVPTTVIIPFLVQAIEPNNASKWMVTLVSAHTPQLIRLDQRIEDRQKLSHGGGQGHFFQFSFCQQTLGEGPDGGSATAGSGFDRHSLAVKLLESIRG